MSGARPSLMVARGDGARGVGRGNLEGARLGPLIGRDVEVARLEGWLAEGRRCLLISGGPGLGKTTLARHVGARMLEHDARATARGVWCVELRGVHDVGAFIQQVADALGTPLTPEQDDAAVRATLGRVLEMAGPTLLILDNFEQLVGVASEALAGWLAGCPALQVVITSRRQRDEALPIDGRLALAPLSVEARGPTWPSPAVALFIASVRAFEPGYGPKGDDLQVLDEIARRLDGAPLAIVLAAARMRILAAPELLRRLERSLALLGSAPKGVDVTLRSALALSWSLLDRWEQRTLAQVAVFRASFDVAAAEAVVDLGDAPDAPWVGDVLQSLMDHSLVIAGEARGRLGLYVSVRDDALRRLVEAGEARATAWRHACHFAARGAGWARALQARSQREVLLRLQGERFELSAALERLVAPERARRTGDAPLLLDGLTRGEGGDARRGEAAQRALELAMGLGEAAASAGASAALDAYFDGALALAGWLPEGARRLHPEALLTRWHVHMLQQQRDLLGEAEQAMAQAQALADPLLEARAASALARERWRHHDLEGALALAWRAHESCDARTCCRLYCTNLTQLSFLMRCGGQTAQALALLEAALPEIEAQDAPGDLAIVLGELAIYRQLTFAPEAALRAVSRAIEVFRDLGDISMEARVLVVQGAALSSVGRVEEAYEALRRALALEARVGSASNASSAHLQLALLMACDGDARGAVEHARACVRLRRGEVNGRALSYALNRLALIHLDAGALAQARATLDETLEVLDAHPNVQARPVTLALLASVEALEDAVEAAQARLDEARAAQGEVEGGAVACHERVAAGLIELARARRGGADAAAAIARAGACLRDCLTPRPAPASMTPSGPPRLPHEASRADRLIIRVLDRGVAPEARLEAWAQALDPGGRALVTSADCARCRLPGGDWIDLSRRKVLARLLEALVEARLEAPRAPVGLDALIERVWADELGAQHTSLINRLHQQISRLRKLGLKAWIAFEEPGYLLSERLEVARAPARL